MTVNQKIAALRVAMQAHHLDAYLIPSGDPHQSEYVADYWKARPWISGFTGSAGTVVITANHGGLWSDSRYFLQAETQLAGSEIKLHKQKIPHAPEHLTWIRDNVQKGGKVGFDGRLFSVGQVNGIAQLLKDKSIELVDTDLISDLWKDRAALPQGTIFEHDVKYTGASRIEKLEEVQAQMQANLYLVSTLDDIAWVLNLRGNDVACNPVFYAYLVIGKTETYLFIEPQKVTETLATKLNSEGIILKPYAALTPFLQNLPKGETIQVDLASTSNQVYQTIPANQIILGQNIIRPLKAIKNTTEVSHIKNAMLKDGVALTRLFRWLDATLEERSVPETEVAEKLIECRRAQGDYHCESFDAIVGYNSNGAIVHYRAEQDTCAHITKEGILLLDSGGQYTDGTTDITRTISLSPPTAEKKRDFTLVLKGHIALATAIFPHGTTGVQLDTLARTFLWKHQLDYGHGTGHGVGFFLNVHEPPQGFATNPGTSRGTTFIVPGMFTSNEPGFYKSGEYGIRIENLVFCVEHGETDFGKFYKFESLTLFPIDLNLVDNKLLTSEEKDWLNKYHQEVFEKLSPLLEAAEVTWMRQKCRAI